MGEGVILVSLAGHLSGSGESSEWVRGSYERVRQVI